MPRSSIDVIEDVLGDRLFQKAWKARSFAELDSSDPTYGVPVISKRQYRHIQEKLQIHWEEIARSFTADRSCLFMNLRHVGLVYQLSSLAPLFSADREVMDRASFDLMVKPQLNLDDGAVVRKALLYSEKVVLNDPAQMLSARPAGAAEMFR